MTVESVSALLRREKFCDVDLSDPFFDSLKLDYLGFDEWFRNKAQNEALIFRSPEGSLEGFLFLKEEVGAVTDVCPNLENGRRLKIGTFKINPHGTRLGERFVKRALDIAVSANIDELYVTVFEKHTALVKLFKKYGFIKVGEKNSLSGRESVYLRKLSDVWGDVVLDYPRIPFKKNRHFVLSLYPRWHSRLLPDSLLNTENSSILDDVSSTNSIHKIYLTAMSGVEQLLRGDTLMIYRTAAEGGSAYYTSVITSLCVVEAVKNINEFSDLADFLAYCSSYSIFTRIELESFYQTRKYPWIILFSYNLALTKRPNRKALLEEVGLAANIYWGFFNLTTPQLKLILKLSEDYEKTRSLVYSP